jgi:hypothetical protein
MASTTAAAAVASTSVLLHDDYRIALFYHYVSIEVVEKHVKWQTSLCKELDLGGRLRVSKEGLNGVLSGTYTNLLQYEAKLSEKLSKGSHDEAGFTNSSGKLLLDLDIKYCLLRPDLSVEAQLFDSLSVKPTPEVISLFNPNDNETVEKKKSLSRRKKGGRVHSIDDVDGNHHQHNQTPKSTHLLDLEEYPAAPHLSPREWQELIAFVGVGCDFDRCAERLREQCRTL